jgi:UDP-glucose 4-epimerase
MKKTCLVIGGDGFIGSHLTEDLLEREYRVRVFGRFKGKKIKNLNSVKSKIEIFPGNFTNTLDIKKALKGVDYVFHFAYLGNPALTIKNPQLDINTNLISTVNLLDQCVKSNVKKVIYPSTGGSIYGKYEGSRAKEESFLNPITPYSINKLAIEKYFHYYKRYFGLDFSIYRIANAYGERQSGQNGQGVIATVIRNMLEGDTIEIYGNTIRDFIYVKDITRFIADNFHKKHKFDVYNLGSGKGVSLAEIVKKISKIGKVKMKLKKMPKREFDVDKVVLDISKIKKEFNFNPGINLNEGIKRTFDYIKDKNYA